jgi:hypothetical protein
MFSFGNPALDKLEFMLYPPLSYLDHLVLQVKITILPPIIDIWWGQTRSAVLSMSISKHILVQKYMLVYSAYYRYLEF